MSQITIQLPDTLRHQLTMMATQEGISVDQYILYILTRQSALTYRLRRVSDEVVRKQRIALNQLLEDLGPPATEEQIANFLASRDVIEPATLAEKEAVARLQQRLRERQPIIKAKTL